jgi:uncharacterized membrane-anchored protein
MEELLSQFGSTFDTTLGLTSYILNIVICAVMLLVLSFFYSRFGNSISNRGQLAKVLVIVGITTFIIITIVKSSLALSLGLVGALSIVRFRTAIKEPEELGYFFMAIAIGLGMAANQVVPTGIGFAVLLLIVALFKKNAFKSSITQNLLVSLDCSDDEKTTITKNIAAVIQKNSSQLEVKRINYANGHVDLNFLVKVSSLNDLNAIQDGIMGTRKEATVTFIDNTL